MLGSNKKAQSAMEYLQTYGWAILVIIVVLAIIFTILSTIHAPQYCLFDDAGMVCSDPVLPAITRDAYLYGKITNVLGKGIILKGTLCVDQPPDPLSYDDNRTNTDMYGKELKYGEGFFVNEFDLQCYTGNKVVNLTQDSFHGHLYVWYNYKTDPPDYPPRYLHALFNVEVAQNGTGDLIEDYGVCGDDIIQKPNSEGQYEQCEYDANCTGEHMVCKGCKCVEGTYCGDGIWQPENDEGVAEECDGNDFGISNRSLDEYSCSIDCKFVENPANCNDDRLQIGETCDGDNYRFGEPVLPCRSPGDCHYCGDGTVQDAYEECERDSDCNVSAGEICVNCTCVSTVHTYCGDDRVQNPNDDGISEECDWGEDNSDSCSPEYGVDGGCTYCDDTTCKLIHVPSLGWCGDGTFQPSYENCEPGIFSLDPEHCGIAPCIDCHCLFTPEPVCNNTKWESGEVCDFSDPVNTGCEEGYECNSDCTACVPKHEPIFLIVQVAGPGGLVSSSPPGIYCPSNCIKEYNYNDYVLLIPHPHEGYVFSGWHGMSGTEINCPGTAPCSITMDSNKTVLAQFNATDIVLCVDKTGSGKGTVTSSPSGISCGPGCSHDNGRYSIGSTVTLYATPDDDSVFSGWITEPGVTCPGTGACSVIMNDEHTVTAIFNKKKFCGDGTIQTPNDDGISEECDTGTQNGVVCTPPPGGSCTYCDSTCHNVTVQSQPITWTFKVGMEDRANDSRVIGYIGSDKVIDCYRENRYGCSAIFDHTVTVTLTANPGPKSVFVRWEGCSEPPHPGSPQTYVTPDGKCVYYVNGPRNVKAVFKTAKLTVVKPVHGTVVSDLPGINCGGDENECEAFYHPNTLVTLNTIPSVGYSFTGWGGSCGFPNLNPTCSLIMNEDKRVYAHFGLKLHVCGNAIKENGYGEEDSEECDWGDESIFGIGNCMGPNGACNSDTEPDACRTDCKLHYCGDGVKDSDEECDDGNDNNEDSCTNDCKRAGPIYKCDEDDDGMNPTLAGWTWLTTESGSGRINPSGDSCDGNILKEKYCGRMSECFNIFPCSGDTCCHKFSDNPESATIFEKRIDCTQLGRVCYLDPIVGNNAAACVVPCSETDGGVDLINKGEVSGRYNGPPGSVYETKTDECVDSANLKEYFCVNDGGDRYSYIIRNCTDLGPNYKCVDGACVES